LSNPTPIPPPSTDADVLRLLQASKIEAEAGRQTESDQILSYVARHAPGHPAVLNELGVRMLGRGVADQAHAMFDRAVKADPSHPALWANLASSLAALGRRDEEREALETALKLEPRHLGALLQKGAHLEVVGAQRAAARVYQDALATIPPGAPPPPALAAALAHAQAIVEADYQELAAALDQPLTAIRQQFGGKEQRRADRCLDILFGKAKPYVSTPTFMYFPELPSIEFFEREAFPWFAALEAATDDIRGELSRVLIADRPGLQPYVDYADGLPIDQWKELNRSRRWSAYFLWNQGAAQTAHQARCPKTVAALRHADQPVILQRAPTAFFSILDANTKIPPHVGATNTRLTVHLPLIVPPGCGFRVGNTTREWVPGRAWAFDDTINHEAWNLSDTPRAILLFDVWNPLLSIAERELVRAATEIYVQHYGLPPESSL